MNEIEAFVIKAMDSEAALAERHEAFSAIVRAFQDMAYSCAYAVLKDFHLAEDAAQEAFISAWQKLHQLRQPKAFPGWFRRIVRSECNRLTRGKRSSIVSLNDDAAAIFENLQTMIEADELQKAAFAAVKKLPENERVVIALFYLREDSQADISRFLEIPTTTVAKRLYSARGRLRGVLMTKFKDEFTAHRPSRRRSFADKVRAGIYDEYIGLYEFEQRPELSVVIRRKGDKLISEAAGQRNALFAENESETELRTKEFDGAGKFVRDDEGRVKHFVYYEFGQEMGRARKIA